MNRKILHIILILGACGLVLALILLPWGQKDLPPTLTDPGPSSTEAVATLENTLPSAQESYLAEVREFFAGKTLSVLGDSISTYQDISNGLGAENSNSTIRDNLHFYPRQIARVAPEDTWWQLTAEALGLRLLVNNSWSGASVLKDSAGAFGAYQKRCVNLHDNTGENAGEKPDFIFFFMGANDYILSQASLGRYEDLAMDTLIREVEGEVIYEKPKTTMEAYAICLHKMQREYPQARIYCVTMLPRMSYEEDHVACNEDFAKVAKAFDVCLVDGYSLGMENADPFLHYYFGDNVHPNKEGMLAISNGIVSAMLKDNGFDTYDVSFDLEGVIPREGSCRSILPGESFVTELIPTDPDAPLHITVTMAGTDITAQSLQGNTVTIPCVTGEVTISAKTGN
jgi:lysophospholipase L1-like esterase